MFHAFRRRRNRAEDLPAARRARALAAAVAGVLLAGFEVASRIFQRTILGPNIGAEAASFHTWMALAGAVLLAALLLIATRSRDHTARELWGIGATWTLLTAIVGAATSESWRSLAADFDPSRGGLFGLVLLICLTAPPLVGWLRAQQAKPGSTVREGD